jgi:hypothetical protein
MQLFYLMLYNMIALFADKTWLGIVVVFFVDFVLVFVRRHWGRGNIARKTLIDERFLY